MSTAQSSQRPETMRETLRRAEREMMADMIKQARARWAALPQIAKDAYVRRLEDDRADVLATKRSVS